MKSISDYLENIESFLFIKNLRLPKTMEEYNDIDEGIRNLVNTLNRMRGFAVFESCYGHIDEENNINGINEECASGYICIEVFDWNWLLVIQLIAAVSEMSISTGFNPFSGDAIIEYALAGYDNLEKMPFNIIIHPVLVLDHTDRVKRWHKSVKRMEKVLSIILKQELSDIIDKAIISQQFSDSLEKYLNNESVLGLLFNIPLSYNLLPDEPILSKKHEED
jgi:hypothetical protein